MSVYESKYRLPGDAPELEEGLEERLKEIRGGMHLRWNREAELVKPGMYNGDGSLSSKPQYEARWELWDVDPTGEEYQIMRIRYPDSSFRMPGQWLINTLHKLNPVHYGGVRKMIESLVEEPEVLRLAGTEKDTDDLIEQVAKWGAYVATPKCGAHTRYHGLRELSGTGGMI